MPLPVLLTFVLLAGALCAVWAPPLTLGRVGIAPWAGLLAAAVVSGVLAGVLYGPALIALGALTSCAYVAAGPARTAPRLLCSLGTGMLALALALHRLPGFDNPVVIAHAALSPGAAPYTQYANFDKGAVGVILLALLCRRVTSRAELIALLKLSMPVAALTAAATFGLGLALGRIGVDVKIGTLTAIFLPVNLCLTVVAEEAFFRGLLQARLADALSASRHGQTLAMTCSALLFGAAHLGGGLPYAAMATIAGFGCAVAYRLTARVEAPIVVHFTLNALHFIVFTYP